MFDDIFTPPVISGLASVLLIIAHNLIQYYRNKERDSVRYSPVSPQLSHSSAASSDIGVISDMLRDCLRGNNEEMMLLLSNMNAQLQILVLQLTEPRGLPRPSGSTSRRDQQIKRLAGKGMNKSEIARRVGCSWNTVDRVLKKRG